MPAPTIPPIPIETAAAMPICPDPGLADATCGDFARLEVMIELAIRVLNEGG